MAEWWCDLLLRVNLALAAGVAVVLALRLPTRRAFGARVAYGLWLLPLAAAAMCFAPARVHHVVIDPAAAALAQTSGAAAQPGYLLWAWLIGAAVSLIVLALRQARFTLALGRLRAREDLGAGVRAAESAAHGPAVIGVLRPLIVTPADFDSRFDPEEQRIVLAHERAHLAHGDPWINAAVVLLQCLNWFNPFVHIGARALRIDQELACDAAVLEQSEGARRRYAEAILKTHVGAAVPIGCAWPPSSLNALKERIAMLKRSLPSRTQTLIGVSAIALAAAGAAVAAWAAQPPRVVATFASADDAAAASAPALFMTAGASADEELAGGDDDRGRIRVMRNGVVITDRDLTPEEREEVRAAVAEARREIEAARVEMESTREAVRAALADMPEIEQNALAAAMAAAQTARAELSVEDRAEIVAEVREAMAEMRAELARVQIELRDLPQVRDALREARVEIAREAEAARRAGDAVEAEALEEALRGLREAERDVDGDR